MTGRPSIYNEELAEEICKRISQGESVLSICEDEGMPVAKTIYNWLLDKDKESFLHKYNNARAIQAELMFDELLKIADKSDGEIMRDRLRVDTRKWYLSKVLPKKFGEKVDVTTDGEKIQIPIYGGKSVSEHDSDTQDI